MRLAFLAVLMVCATPALAACPAPKNLAFVVEKAIHRSAPGFTEGLEMQGGTILESTGDLFGNSRINRIDPRTGKVTVLVDAGKRYFGEGLTLFEGRLFQMTWREHRVFVFDPHMKPLSERTNPREGWGLTHDGTRLIASDGSSNLFFLSPADFSTLGTLPVLEEDRPVVALNELEYADGAIWANVFESWTVMKISPATGCVEARANIAPLREHMTAGERRAIDADPNFVPNGIAHNPATGAFILTGKNWPMLFSGHFVPLD
jgi:glutamine cyclotransferase